MQDILKKLKQSAMPPLPSLYEERKKVGWNKVWNSTRIKKRVRKMFAVCHHRMKIVKDLFQSFKMTVISLSWRFCLQVSFHAALSVLFKYFLVYHLKLFALEKGCVLDAQGCLPQASLSSWGEIRRNIVMLQSIHNLMENNFIGTFLTSFNYNNSLVHIIARS